MRPWNVIMGQWNVSSGPCTVVIGLRNVIMGPWNVNRGQSNVIGYRVM